MRGLLREFVVGMAPSQVHNASRLNFGSASLEGGQSFVRAAPVDRSLSDSGTSPPVAFFPGIIGLSRSAVDRDRDSNAPYPAGTPARQPRGPAAQNNFGALAHLPSNTNPLTNALRGVFLRSR